ncbi:hypothetical protein BC829DRAFT_422784 [Chytridium lagenaria]|nr:hypothetical protein BC829DRAFT_422784 [Chytridium lagenaria]
MITPSTLLIAAGALLFNANTAIAMPQQSTATTTSLIPTTTSLSPTATSTRRALIRAPDESTTTRNLIIYCTLAVVLVILSVLTWYFYIPIRDFFRRPLYKGQQQTPMYKEEWYHRDDPEWLARNKERLEREAAQPQPQQKAGAAYESHPAFHCVWLNVVKLMPHPPPP